jgi:hypothetical protein
MTGTTDDAVERIERKLAELERLVTLLDAAVLPCGQVPSAR